MRSDDGVDARVSLREIRDASEVKNTLESLRSDVAKLTEIVLGLQAKVDEERRAHAETRGDEPPSTVRAVANSNQTRTLCNHRYHVDGQLKTCCQPASYDEDGVRVQDSDKPPVNCGKHRNNKPPRKDKGKKRDASTMQTSDSGGKCTRDSASRESAQKTPRMDAHTGKKHLDVNLLDSGSRAIAFTMIETGGSAADDATATSPTRPNRSKDHTAMAFGTPVSTGCTQSDAQPEFVFEELLGHGSPAALGPSTDPLLRAFNPWDV